MPDSNIKMLLYVIKPGDTLESIAEQFQTTKEEIYRLNTIIKHHHIYTGMPLNIAVSPSFLARSNSEEVKKEENKKECSSFSFLYHDLAFYEKEAIVFQFLYEKYVPILTTQIQKMLRHILLNYIEDEKRITNLQDIYMDFHSSLLRLCKSIQEKNTSTLPSIKANLSECMKKFIQKLRESSFKNEIVSFLKNTCAHILLLWQNYILHISGQKLQEAEDDFIRLLHDYEEIHQALLHKEKSDREHLSL